MPLVKMPFQPGVDKQDTEYGAEGKWFDSDNMRFRYGLPEKIGGWVKVTTDALVGATRGILTWFDNDGDQYTIIGTNKKVYVYADGAWSDITPIRSATNAITVITTNTTAGTESNVTITDVSHGAITGDFVTISGTPGAVNGITQTQLLGEFEIIEVLSTSQYIITTTGTATSAGAVSVSGTNASYEINTKPAVSVAGYGWGTGTWGLSTWGTSRAGITGADAVQLDSGKWSFDNWGEDVLCQQFNGGLFYWDTSGGVTVPAVKSTVTNAPTRSRFILVSGTDRFVICFGTEETIGTTSSQDDMFIRWSSQNNPNIWVPTSTNTAGFQRLTDGSRLVSAARSRGAVLIWSDTALYQMQLIGAPLVFGFTQLGAKCGSAGLHAAIDVNGTAYWMGRDSFFGFDGKVSKIPCSVEDYVFGDIDEASQKDTFAAANSEFNEVTWFYCSNGSSQIDRCVTYNYEEKVWSVGTLDRTSWADKGVYNFPYATSYEASDTSSTITTINGLTAGRTFMYAQENGVNADGAAMTSFIESGSFVIPQAGENLMSIRRFIPDFKNLAGTVDVSLKFRLYPTSEQITNGPHEVATTTEFVDTRARGRQAAVRIESSTLDSTWRYGTYRADVHPDGRR
tara:strand:- start:1431 stop:3305 length:1875 start_codon:yes stop_codon:yes gene_type:complete